MRIVVSIFAILFGLLHLTAAVIQFKSKDPAARGFAISMASGGICLTFDAIAHLAGSILGNASTAAVGCLLICFAAFANGKRSGNFHPSHHLVRGIIAVLLVVGFAVW